MFRHGFLVRHGNRRHLPAAKSQRVAQDETDLSRLATDAGEFFDPVTRFGNDLRRPLAKVPFQRRGIRCQTDGASFFMKLPHGIETTLGKNVQDALHRPPRRGR